MAQKPQNVIDASSQVAELVDTRQVRLTPERVVTINRLNWLQFEVLWAEIPGSLAPLLVADPDPDPATVVAEFSTAPQLVVRLVGQATTIDEQELASWPFDDVLAVAAAAVELNFTESAGVRSFFLAASALLGPDQLTGSKPDIR